MANWLTRASKPLPLVLLSTVLGVMAAGLWAWSLPDVYRSQTTILIVPSRVTTFNELPLQSASIGERLQHSAQLVLNQTRLEGLIEDLQLRDALERSRTPGDLITRFRRDVLLSVNDAERDNLTGFTVGFQAASPEAALKVTERLASMFVQEQLRDWENLAAANSEFVRVRIESARQALESSGQALAARRASGNAPGESAIVEHEVLKDALKDLLVKQQHIETTTLALKRQLGEQFKVAEGARLPSKPIGPNRLAVTGTGGLGGLSIGLLLAGVLAVGRRRS